MDKTILIATELQEHVRATHAKWLWLLLRQPLQTALPQMRIVYGTLSDDAAESADIIIGFELSDTSKRSLSDADALWIDLRIAPIRYLDDIYFTFETSSSQIREHLKRYRIGERLCRYHADLISAAMLKQKKRRHFPKNTLLLIGQTERDSVVFDGERYLTLADRIDTLRAMAENAEHILFKPHPYAKNGGKILRALRRGVGKKIEVTYENIYRLLSDEHIVEVAALNSSVLYEAEYFGKKTSFLYRRVFSSSQIGIYGDYFSGTFWSDIFSEVFPTTENTLGLPVAPSRLRRTLNDFWTYPEIADEVVLHDIVKTKIKRLLSRVR